MNYCRAVALAHGHPPERIDRMRLRDLELLAAFTTIELRSPFIGEDT